MDDEDINICVVKSGGEGVLFVGKRCRQEVSWRSGEEELCFPYHSVLM